VARIPTTVVTGFLGAGKSTLIRHLPENGGGRLAVVVNAVGDVGIDGEIRGARPPLRLGLRRAAG
jgi:cobalamin biosynthesis protein CobW